MGRAYLPPSFVNWVGEFAIRLTSTVRRDPKLNGRCEVMALPTSFWRVKDCVSPVEKFWPIGSWIWVRNSYTQQCRQMRGSGRSSRTVESAGDQMGVDLKINRWRRVGGISTQTGRGLIGWTWGWLPAWSGGLLDPGHGSWRGPCHHECVLAGLPNICCMSLLIFFDQLWERETRSVQRTCHAGRAGWRSNGGTPVKLNRTTKTAQNTRYRSSPIKTDDTTRSVEAAQAMWWRKRTVTIDRIKVNREILAKVNESTARTRPYPII